MSPVVRRIFLHFLPKLMMMRRTKYILPDYDDNAPSHGYINEIDVRDSVSDFTSDYKIDGHDSSYENNVGASMPHSSGERRNLLSSPLRFCSLSSSSSTFNLSNSLLVRASSHFFNLLFSIFYPINASNCQLFHT